MATKWKQMERIIAYVAEGRKKKLLKKGGASNKHHAVFVKLYHNLRKREVWGEKLPMHGFTLTPIQLMPIKTQAHPRIPKSEAMRFIKHYNIKLRRVQRKIQVQKGRFEEKMKQ